MKTAREQAVDCASNIYDILIEWGVSMPRDIRGDVQEEVINLVTAALEEKEREIETEREHWNRAEDAWDTADKERAALREQLAEAVKFLEPMRNCADLFTEYTSDLDIATEVNIGHCRAAAAFLAKHTHTEKPDGKLQKPLDTHAKPL